MKCPECNHVGKALVTETRKHEGSVYRRRSCGKCGASYITVETAPAGLKMPAAVNGGTARGHQPKRAGPRMFKSVATAAHLQGFLSGGKS